MSQTEQIKLEPGWKQALLPEFQKPYMQNLRDFLKKEYKTKTIYPKASQIFASFNYTPLDKVKVLILGQDPYHGPNQAHGLCFSVPPQTAIPPSLKNIYKELQNDLGFPPPDHGCLIPWAQQGVLLLNATLSVERGKAGSHQGKGWETFTDQVIQYLSQHKEHLVFVLWGSYAQKKASLITPQKHLILKAPHPSPLSAHRGFFGSRPFSKINTYLEQHHIAPINWKLPPKSELDSYLKKKSL
ncbi:MAG: uracil-DNA glycosylase [Bdellovibrio sp.]|nr:MAG: uracil-DNA glycosylase [Bdellovibrio sp.]